MPLLQIEFESKHIHRAPSRAYPQHFHQQAHLKSKYTNPTLTSSLTNSLTSHHCNTKAFLPHENAYRISQLKNVVVPRRVSRANASILKSKQTNLVTHQLAYLPDPPLRLVTTAK